MRHSLHCRKLLETRSRYVLSFDLEEILRYASGTLTLRSGKRWVELLGSSEHNEAGPRQLNQETSRFDNLFLFPKRIDRSALSCNFEGGTLNIVVPKAA